MVARTRRGVAAAFVTACAAVLSVTAAFGQTAGPQVKANPDQGTAGSVFTLTLTGFDFLPGCDPHQDKATRQTCIYVDFNQGAKTRTIAVASGSGASTVNVPPACTPQVQTQCVDPGGATIVAKSPNGQQAQTTFTVTTAPPPPTTTTAASTTTTTAAATTTTAAATTSSSSSTTVTTIVLATTSTTGAPVVVKKSSSHSDVPRYIAVGLVVAAAAATAAVDTRLRRLRGPLP